MNIASVCKSFYCKDCKENFILIGDQDKVCTKCESTEVITSEEKIKADEKKKSKKVNQ
jgi:hypothetical protein